MDATGPRVVLVHDWLTGMRGGEKCLEVACRRYPHAPLYTLLHSPGKLSPAIEDRPIVTSFLQHLPGVARYYRHLLPVMPSAVQNFRLPKCDLVVSFSHCVAKGVRAPKGVPHVCYCFTPMRYLWDQRAAYFARHRGLKGRLIHAILDRLQAWDRATADRVTHFIAISRTVQERIRTCYGRDSVIIYPPADTAFYTPEKVRREDYYLVVSAFAPYKRLDQAIEACNRLKRHLLIIGTGQDEGRLRALAGPTIQFAGWQPDAVIRDHLRRCRALLFPGEEDFGIVPVEANACGAPVIALGRGGATETVAPLGGPEPATGVWYEQQTVAGLAAAIERFEKEGADVRPEDCRRQALRFQKGVFEERLLGYLESVAGTKPAALRRAA